MAKKNPFITTAHARSLFADGTLDASKITDDAGNPVSTASLFGVNNDGKVRGKLHPAFIQAVADAGMGIVQPKMPKPEPTVTLKVTKVNKNGHPYPVKVQVTSSELRTLAGKPGSRGRLSETDFANAAEAWVKANA